MSKFLAITPKLQSGNDKKSKLSSSPMTSGRPSLTSTAVPGMESTTCSPSGSGMLLTGSQYQTEDSVTGSQTFARSSSDEHMYAQPRFQYSSSYSNVGKPVTVVVDHHHDDIRVQDVEISTSESEGCGVTESSDIEAYPSLVAVRTDKTRSPQKRTIDCTVSLIAGVLCAGILFCGVITYGYCMKA